MVEKDMSTLGEVLGGAMVLVHMMGRTQNKKSHIGMGCLRGARPQRI